MENVKITANYTLKLSLEELVCCASLLGIENLPTLDGCEFNLTNDEVISAIREGEISLEKRSLIKRSPSNDWSIDSVLSSILHWFAFPDAIIIQKSIHKKFGQLHSAVLIKNKLFMLVQLKNNQFAFSLNQNNKNMFLSILEDSYVNNQLVTDDIELEISTIDFSKLTNFIAKINDSQVSNLIDIDTDFISIFTYYYYKNNIPAQQNQLLVIGNASSLMAVKSTKEYRKNISFKSYSANNIYDLISSMGLPKLK